MPAQKQYEWRENNACVATYKVLEGDKFLDQFEDADIPFAKAPTVKMKKLRYYPQSTTNPQIIEMLSYEMARAFVSTVVKVFIVSKQSSTATSGAVITKIAKVFADGEKTIRELAEVVDANLKFPDEN